MIKNLVLILAYPFWFATGLAGRKLTPKDPKFSLIYAHTAYWTLAILHWGYAPAPLIGSALNWLIVQWLCKPKYKPVVLLAWAATDALYLMFDWHSTKWDILLFLIYVALSISEPDPEPNIKK